MSNMPKIILRSKLHFYEKLKQDKKDKTRKLQGAYFSSLSQNKLKLNFLFIFFLSILYFSKLDSTFFNLSFYNLKEMTAPLINA